MSVTSSIINTQPVSIDSLICPQGRALATAPNLVAEKSKIAYNLTDNKIWYCTGSVWQSISDSSNVTLAAVGAVPNANGASIDANQVLNLQPANASFPGVVTTGAQTFAGTKTFSAIVAPGTNYTAVAPISATDANGVIIDNTLKQITLENADATHPGIVTTGAQTFAGAKYLQDGITVSPTITGSTSILTTYYRTTSTISVTWDPTHTIWASSPVAGIRCERIGNMIFIKFDYFKAVPSGGGILYSPDGIIPAQFRPANNRGSQCVVINGYINATVILQVLPPNNIVPGWCIITSSGRIAIAAAQITGIPVGIQDDDNTLTPFQGPNSCGLISQTLVFEAD